MAPRTWRVVASDPLVKWWCRLFCILVVVKVALLVVQIVVVALKVLNRLPIVVEFKGIVRRSYT